MRLLSDQGLTYSATFKRKEHSSFSGMTVPPIPAAV